MIKKNLKIFLIIIGVFTFIFGGINFSLAAVPTSEVTRKSPTDGSTNIPINAYFKWDAVSGATRYILTIDEFAEEQDNITATTYCTGCTGADCCFGFLALTIGSIEEGSQGYPETYHWKVRAANNDGDGPTQSTWWGFTTEIETAPPPPPPDGGDGNGGGPVGLINPLEAQTLEEAINALINFLFLLAFTLGPLLIIYAAFLILSAAGNAAQLQKGKNIILWTLVALTIILLAKGLPSIIKGALGG